MLDALAPPLAAWMRAAHGGLTPAQEAALPRLLRREHLLLSSPTGSGKTLAAFLGVLDDLARVPPGPGIACVYVSPLRALVHDMARNLAAPLSALGLTLAIRTGDTPASERQRQARAPPHIFVTTPESLALLLSSPKAREALVGLRWVVVDEIHALAQTKRGAQLSLALERLDELARREGAPSPVRVGLSATVAPLDRVAAFLGGGREVSVAHVEPPEGPVLDVEMPLPDPIRARDDELEEATLARIVALVEQARASIVFANTRKQAERLAARLRDRFGDAVEEEIEEESVDPEFGAAQALSPVAPHHGSMSKESRLVVEERLRRGEIRCVVASSSLELGIHADAIDRVVLVGNPKSASGALQRIGRSGHGPGGQSLATLLVDDPAELAEALATAALVRRREIEEVRIPENALDVLAQHLLAMALDAPRAEDAALALTRRAWPYRTLGVDDLDATLDHLERAGLVRRREGAFEARGGRARMTYLTHAGAIPESGLMKVLHGERYVGEVEEAFAETLQPHDAFLLAGEAWRLVRADGMRLHVVPARPGSAALPAWRSEGLSASAVVARATQDVFREHCLGSLGSNVTESALEDFLASQAAFSSVPSPDEAAFESFPTDEGARALVAHAWLGRRANEALGRALARRVALRLEANARSVATDAGFAILAPRSWRPTRATLARLVAEPLERDLLAALEGQDLPARRFRHVAMRGLLLLRREGQPLSIRQRMAGAMLRRMRAEEPEHPLAREAMRETLHDALDLEGAEAWRARVAEGALPIRLLPERPCASPLAARIVAPPGEQRRAFLRDNAERISEYHDITLARAIDS